jgi:uncharacterized protein (TIGR03437 family)
MANERTGMRAGRLLVLAGFLCTATQIINAQTNILGTNLIVNGNAEAGPAGTATTLVATIPNWTVTGGGNVLSYGLSSLLQTSDPAPPDHGFQYFVAGGGHGVNAVLIQDIDVSSAATGINAGTIKYTASAYLGSGVSSTRPDEGPAQMSLAFKNANGQTISTITLGPAYFPGLEAGLSFQQQIGLLPSGTARVTITLGLNSFNGEHGAADSLSLVLSQAGSGPGLGTNLVVNGSAEAGPAAPIASTVQNIPGWSTNFGASVASYGGTGWISTSDPGPVDRGVNVFCGFHGQAGGSMYQDVDVSPVAALIDSGQVTYQLSAWLGAVTISQAPTLSYVFFDWSGKQLAATGQLGPGSHVGTSLIQTSHSASLPAGTRVIHLTVNFPTSASALADNISFTLAAPSGPPVISPAGVVSASAFGGFSIISPGSWIEIYGTDLAAATRGWSTSDFSNGVAPTSLSGVSVSVGGVPAFVDYISSNQINALVPSSASAGVQQIKVTNSNGVSDGFAIVVNPTEPGLLAPPAFQIGTKQYLAALFPDNQTFALPEGAIAGVASRPAVPGDTLTIYGVGFGPVSGAFTAGTIVTQQNSLTTPLQFLFGSTAAVVMYYGLVPSFTGLYQFNVVVPKIPTNSAAPVSFTLGGMKGTQSLYVAVQN